MIALSSLDGTNGFALHGVDDFNRAGSSVSSAGDLNGDGIADLLISADNADANSRSCAGETYIVFGRADGFRANFAFGSLLPQAGGDGSAGFVVKGIDAFDFSGVSLDGVGDVNGDGIDDFVIGADAADPNGHDAAGESYVVFGRATGFPATFALRSLLPQAGGDGSKGFVLKGIDADDHSGNSVSGAGDVNGDGIGDLLIGAYAADPNGQDEAGESYVVFGRATNFPATFELRSLLPQAGGDGSAGFVLRGVDAGDGSGGSVSSAGDVNGDGIADLLIGASGSAPNGHDHAGETYVVFGRASGFPAVFELGSLFPGAGGDGTAGFILMGVDELDYSGGAVSGAGDVNADGIADLLIGATQADPDGRINAGESYVVFGRATRFPAVFELGDLDPRAGGDGSTGFILRGIDVLDFSGTSVGAAGDVNGDGIADVFIGSSQAAASDGSPGAGESYVVFGRETGFPAAFELRSLDPLAGGDGSAGFILRGIDFGDFSGSAVSGAGDVNGDGVADLVIGAHGAGTSPRRIHAGEAYVVFGRAALAGAGRR